MIRSDKLRILIGLRAATAWESQFGRLCVRVLYPRFWSTSGVLHLQWWQKTADPRTDWTGDDVLWDRYFPDTTRELRLDRKGALTTERKRLLKRHP